MSVRVRRRREALPRRSKRDSVTNLYNKCQITGDCPPDVVNKVEGKTIADWILKIGSSILYFGGLGIGTGGGRGTATGYRPLGEGPGVRVGSGGVVPRPGIPPEPLGPLDIAPIDAQQPEVPSVIPMVDEPVDVGVPEVEVISEIDPLSAGGSGTGTQITHGEGSAILEVTPSSERPVRVRVTTTDSTNPAYVHFSGGEPASAGETSLAGAVVVDFGAGGEDVGGEYIPLEEFNPREEFDIEDSTGPRTSTPLDRLARITQGVRRLYNRRLVEQVPVRDQAFLTRPSSLVRFEYENPAFEDEVSLVFDQDLRELAQAAPSRDFADVVRLGRPVLSEAPGGQYVRYSRPGTRGTIRTRSGAQIGAQVHFYYDMSTIDGDPAIELSVLGEQSGDATIVQGQAESTFVDVDVDEPSVYSDDQLLDVLGEDFEDSHLVFTFTGRSRGSAIPVVRTQYTAGFVEDVGDGIFISHPTERHTPAMVLPFPDRPPILFDPFGSDDFLVDPSLFRRLRRKRKRPAL
nr:MAG: L2 protein [Varecia rubra papillomavirus 1]